MSAVYGQWNTVQDSGNDSIGRISTGATRVGNTEYEMYGLAYKEAGDKIIFAVSSRSGEPRGNLNPVGSGVASSGANDGDVKFGDLILNFNSGQTLNQANGNLYTIHFDGDNDSNAGAVGVYNNVTAKSVAAENGLLLNNYASYVNYVNNNGGSHSAGSLPGNYLNGSEHVRNVIAGGNRVGGVQMLASNDPVLQGLAGQPGFNNNQPIYAFSVDKSALPQGDFTAHLAPECANDLIGIRGTITNPAIDVEKLTQGIDADTEEEAVGVREGDMVTWTYVVTNTGDVDISGDDIIITDPVLLEEFNLVPQFVSESMNPDGILEVGEEWIYTAQAPAIVGQTDIDFETDANGQDLAPGTVIDDEYQAAGLTISTFNKDGTPHPYGAMIFDTANPTGGDDDLATPNENVGPLNQVLILSANGNPDDPNDSAAGGIFVFDWNEPVDLDSISFLDIEEPGNTVTIYYQDDQEKVFNLEALGDKSFQELEINLDQVTKMEVFFVGSGAITGLDLDWHHQNVARVELETAPSINDQDPSHYTHANPGIDIEKSTNGIDGDIIDDAVQLRSGEQVTWEYVVTNTGNVPFARKDVQVTDNDPNLTLVFDPSSDKNGDNILEDGETWVYRAYGRAENTSVKLDFETDANGQDLAPGTIIDTEYEVDGLTVKALTKGRQPHPHGAMIFDTADPTGDDDDLRTPNDNVGALNQVLILSQNGRTDDPNDSAAGGIFVFEWDDPVDIDSLSALDIEEDGSEQRGNIIIAYDENGDRIGNPVPLQGLGDTSFQTLDLGFEQVQKLEVIFTGSGAITDLEYSTPYQNIGTVAIADWEDEGITDSDTSHYVLVDDSDPVFPMPIIIDGSSLSDEIRGTSFDDFIRGFGSRDVISGFGGNDRINGGVGNDIVSGRAGHDCLIGAQGNDWLNGHAGDDKVFAGSGRDRLRGHSGHDLLLGGDHNDVINGGIGRDRLFGQAGSDRIVGGAHNDSLFGGNGYDRLLGQAGSDRIAGGAHKDILIGGAGRDRLFGQAGHDVMLGGAHQDVLFGGMGNDQINGQSGNDVITTGAGRDRIVIQRGQGFDRVTDFRNNLDKLDLRGISYRQLDLVQRGDDVLIRCEGENLVRLEDTNLHTINQADFV